jgi:hypothetical protein
MILSIDNIMYVFSASIFSYSEHNFVNLIVNFLWFITMLDKIWLSRQFCRTIMLTNKITYRSCCKLPCCKLRLVCYIICFTYNRYMSSTTADIRLLALIQCPLFLDIEQVENKMFCTNENGTYMLYITKLKYVVLNKTQITSLI